MKLSIRSKVTLGSLLAVGTGLAVASWLALGSIERLELTRLTEALASQAGLAALSLEPMLGSQARGSPLQSMARELGRRASARVTIISADGTVLADSYTSDEAVPRMENQGARPEVLQALATGRGTDIRVSEAVGQRMLYLAIPVGSSGAPPAGLVRLAMPLTTVEVKIRNLQYALGLAIGAAFLVSVALSIVLARGLTRPFSDMAAMARRLADGALGERIRIRSQDEVGMLAMTFNRMADELESKIREVSEERAQLLAMLRSMVEGILVLDCRGTVLLVNPALERMFRIRGAAVRGRPHDEVIRHEALNTLIHQVLERRQSRSGEVTILPSGQTFHVEVTIAGCRSENETYAVLVFHDVTALRRLENVRKDFVANVSHELRTPLTSIKGYVEALLDGAKDDPAQASRFLETILKQSDRLTLILEDLLQLSQIESGAVLFKRDPIRLKAVVDRTLALIKPLADKRGHHVTLAVSQDLPPVTGDQERLVQVLTNLLDNAVKYTPEHGSIHIEGRYIDAEPPMLELSVADTGLGIPEADRPRVFERFYRVDKARSRELGGTGLGLAIVKHIVEAHGGQVWAEANQPTGSRFVVRLPAAGDLQPEVQRSEDGASENAR